MCDADDLEILCDICEGIAACCCCFWFFAIRYEQPAKKTAIIVSEKSQSLNYVPNPTVAGMVPKPQIAHEKRRPSLGQKIMAAERKKSSMALRTPRSEISGNGFMIPQSRLNSGESQKKNSLVPDTQIEAVKRQSWNKNILDTERNKSPLAPIPRIKISEKYFTIPQRTITFEEPTSNSPNHKKKKKSPKNPYKNSNKNLLKITNEINRQFSYKNENPVINYYIEKNSKNSDNSENSIDVNSSNNIIHSGNFIINP